MAPPLELLNITDLHLCADPESRLHGWHVERAFQTVLAAAVERYPDFDVLVLGGDLVDDESAAGYQRLNRHVGAFGRPVLAMAGNHDDPVALARHLGCARVHDALTVVDWQLIALDSHQNDRESGCVGIAQRAALETHLAAHDGPALVFLHHPPLSIGSDWIDAIGLDNRDDFAACIARYPQIAAIVCGHAHQAQHLALGATTCLITPATMRQFKPRSPTFAEDLARAPGYRHIALGADGRWSTRVHRVPAARAACG